MACKLSRAAAMVRSMSESVCADGNEQRFELRRRKKDSALEHGVEERGEALRVRFFRRGVIADMLAGEKQGEQRTSYRNFAGDAGLLQRGAQAFGEALRLRIKRVVKPSRLKLRQCCQSRAHRQRIARKRPRLINRPERRNHFHDVAASAIGRHRQPPADNFPEYGQVRPNAEGILRAAIGDAEAGDHFVENQQRAVALRDFAQALKKSRLPAAPRPCSRPPVRRSPRRFSRRAAGKVARPRRDRCKARSSVSSASAAGTPGLAEMPSVASPEPASTRKLSAWPW